MKAITHLEERENGEYPFFLCYLTFDLAKQLMKEKKEDYPMTATLKQRKLAGFVITLIASLIFIALSLSLIILTLQQGGSLSIENTTLIVLQFAALIFLLIGMLIHKENLILGTLVAAMASTVVSYMVNDVTSIVTGTLSFSGAWYLTASVVVSLVLDAFLSLGTISFLIYLLNGHQPTTRSVISFFFAGYLALALLQIVFISFGLAASAGERGRSGSLYLDAAGLSIRCACHLCLHRGYRCLLLPQG
jgi:hypothetical protein